MFKKIWGNKLVGFGKHTTNKLVMVAKHAEYTSVVLEDALFNYLSSGPLFVLFLTLPNVAICH